jgi:hypothetical protein
MFGIDFAVDFLESDSIALLLTVRSIEKALAFTGGGFLDYRVSGVLLVFLRCSKGF